jgi:uncharacterized membrane protein
MNLRRPCRRVRDERGATLILVAISMIMLLWGGAFAVDLGLTTVGNRQVQNIADTASLDVARYLNVADWNSLSITTPAKSVAYLNGKLANAATDNGSPATLTETAGVWLNGTFTPEGSYVGTPAQLVRCYYYSPPLTYPCNAVKVSATQSVPQIFVGGTSTVTRSSIAEVSPEAGFSVGSYLAAINTQQSAFLNALLGTLCGTANVTVVGYEGLANTNVTINQLIAASGGLLTTSNVMTTSESGSTWQSIWNAAVANQVAQLNCSATPTPLPCSASTALSGPNAMDLTSATQAKLCQFVSINGATCSSGNLNNVALETSLNALQTFTTEAEVAHGTNALDLGTSLGITGVTDAKVTLTMSQIPQVAFGPVGTTASTAQLSTDLQLNLQGVGLINIPLSAAQGTGTLQALRCAYNSMSATTIQPTTTTVSGTVTSPVGGGTLTLSGYNSGTTSAFSYAPSVVPPTATTAANGSNPKSVGSTTPNPTWTGLTVPTSSPAYTLLTSTLSGVLGPILQAAGAAVGGIQVADLGTNCGSVSLVQ